VTQHLLGLATAAMQQAMLLGYRALQQVLQALVALCNMLTAASSLVMS
jgi:hypothetical protein